MKNGKPIGIKDAILKILSDGQQRDVDAILAEVPKMTQRPTTRGTVIFYMGELKRLGKVTAIDRGIFTNA